MKAIIFGLGMQGRAALHHLASSRDVDEIIVADSDLAQARENAKKFGGRKTKCVKLDASNLGAVRKLMGSGADVVIDLLPVRFTAMMAELAVEAGVHLVNTVYAKYSLQKVRAALHEKAARKGIAILPEFGFDPGIDLVMGAHALREFERVDYFYSYGGGIPEPKACANPLNYKVSWTFEGVLRSHKRDARIIKDGKITYIPSKETCAARNTHKISINGLGEMEAIPNGDAAGYRRVFKLGRDVKDMGRFTLRWPGHCSFWKKMADLRFLDDKPIMVDSSPVVPVRFLHHLLEPQLQYRASERDVAVAMVEVRGLRNGRKSRVTYELLDYRDLNTGLMAMNRTVGYTAAIGAMMILRDDITKRGVLSPARDVDFDLLCKELRKCGMRIKRKESRGTGRSTLRNA